jgi:hypothetical protein
MKIEITNEQKKKLGIIRDVERTLYSRSLKRDKFFIRDFSDHLRLVLYCCQINSLMIDLDPQMARDFLHLLSVRKVSMTKDSS